MNANLPFEDERLTAYLDGELSAADALALEAEIDASPELQAELEALSTVATYMCANVPVVAPPDLLDEILARTAEEAPVVQLAWYRRPFGIPLEGLAVAAAALLVVYVALPGRAPTDSAPPADAPSSQAAAARTVETPVAEEAKSDADEELDELAGDAVAAAEIREIGADGKRLEEEAWKKTAELEALRKAREAGLERAKDAKAADFEIPNAQQGIGEQGVGDETVDLDVGKPKALFAQVPYSYAITTTDPAVLAQLAALAARYSGELKGSKESPLQIAELSGSDAATVMVKLPSHALKDFGRALGGLGTVTAMADNSMFAGDPVEVRVSVQLVGGSPETIKAPSKANRKAMPMSDMLEDAGEAL